LGSHVPLFNATCCGKARDTWIKGGGFASEGNDHKNLLDTVPKRQTSRSDSTEKNDVESAVEQGKKGFEVNVPFIRRVKTLWGKAGRVPSSNQKVAAKSKEDCLALGAPALIGGTEGGG